MDKIGVRYKILKELAQNDTKPFHVKESISYPGQMIGAVMNSSHPLWPELEETGGAQKKKTRRHTTSRQNKLLSALGE